jgi:hypothetical protein
MTTKTPKSQIEILQEKFYWLEGRLNKIEKTYISRYWNDGSGPSGTLFEFDRRLGKLEQAQTFRISQTDIDRSDDPKATVQWLKNPVYDTFFPPSRPEFDKWLDGGIIAKIMSNSDNQERRFAEPKVDVSAAIAILQLSLDHSHDMSGHCVILPVRLYDEANAVKAAIQILKDYQRGNNGENK